MARLRALELEKMEPQAGMVVALEAEVAGVVEVPLVLRLALAAEAETDLFVCFLGKEQK